MGLCGILATLSRTIGRFRDLARIPPQYFASKERRLVIEIRGRIWINPRRNYDTRTIVIDILGGVSAGARSEIHGRRIVVTSDLRSADFDHVLGPIVCICIFRQQCND